MSLTHDDMKKLKAFFDASDHEFDYNKNAYITEGAITDRIETVDPAWSLSEPKIFWRDGEKGTHICEVTVVMTIKGASRGAVGQKEIVLTKNGNAEANQAAKSAATDALKRAARLFGIGRYLLSLPKDVSDPKTMAKWLSSQNQDPDAWDETNMRAFWNHWTQQTDKDTILSALGVQGLSEWQHSLSAANERMEIELAKGGN